MAEIRWERMTAPELKALAAKDALVVLPIGSLEQHGPHLPVWTDSLCAHEIALRGAVVLNRGVCAVVIRDDEALGRNERGRTAAEGDDGAHGIAGEVG